MEKSKQARLMVSLPPEVRNSLRIMAAQQNLDDPEQTETASGVARQIIIKFYRQFIMEN
ncbi:hypothetical protein [Desulfatibacillum aliphaticivorans]|uniref:hypothetical protein n=1 Tax=Desulfatibacillum aliphaticivorans TaxID=218208 RepID=UPI00143B3C94|nr:hypothetical protein [Desulfatibacillum aliphaticivorans]